jgi:adenine-specific DNA-methyltransferase
MPLTSANAIEERVQRLRELFPEAFTEGKLDLADRDEPEDLGFKVSKLTSSNFRLWNAETAPREADPSAQQLRLHAENVLPGRSQQTLCLDHAFGGNDQLGNNTVLEMCSHGIEFRTV